MTARVRETVQAVWLLAKIALFLGLSLRGLDIIVVAYQRF